MYNPKAKHSCSVVGCTDPHVSLHRLPTKEHHQLDSTPPPPRQSQPGLDWPSGVPPPSVVGRNGRRGEISRTSRRNSLFTPPRQQSRSPPPPPPPRRRSVLWLPGPNLVQSSPGHNTHPSKAHTHRRLTLTPARTYCTAVCCPAAISPPNLSVAIVTRRRPHVFRRREEMGGANTVFGLHT